MRSWYCSNNGCFCFLLSCLRTQAHTFLNHCSITWSHSPYAFAHNYTQLYSAFLESANFYTDLRKTAKNQIWKGSWGEITTNISQFKYSCLPSIISVFQSSCIWTKASISQLTSIYSYWALLNIYGEAASKKTELNTGGVFSSKVTSESRCHSAWSVSWKLTVAAAFIIHRRTA